MKANSTGAFIIFASGRIDVAVIDCFCGLGYLDLIGYSTDAEVAVSQVLENEPQIVIIDSRDRMDVACRVIGEVRNLALVVIVI